MSMSVSPWVLPCTLSHRSDTCSAMPLSANSRSSASPRGTSGSRVLVRRWRRNQCDWSVDRSRSLLVRCLAVKVFALRGGLVVALSSKMCKVTTRHCSVWMLCSASSDYTATDNERIEVSWACVACIGKSVAKDVQGVGRHKICHESPRRSADWRRSKRRTA